MATTQETEKQINSLLNVTNIRILFSDEAAMVDLPSYDKGMRNRIIAAILKKCKQGPLLIPEGGGLPLSGKLVTFGKIRMLKEGIRIIYRPTELPDGKIRVEVSTIGPREDEEAYKIAASRLPSFFKQMKNREWPQD